MMKALVIAILAVLAATIQGALSRRHELKMVPTNGTSVPNLLRSPSGVVPKTIDMTQHVLTQSGNMLVLSTPVKPTATAAVDQQKVFAQQQPKRTQPYHLPKRTPSIRDQILRNSNLPDTKARAKNHKLQVPTRQKKVVEKPVPSPPKVDKKPAPPKVEKKPAQPNPKVFDRVQESAKRVPVTMPALSREATKTATVAKRPVGTAKVANDEAPQPKKDAEKHVNSAKTEAKKPTHKVGLLMAKQVDEEKSQMSLASFYAEEDMKESTQHSWHFAAHMRPDSFPLPAHKAQQHKVAALLDQTQNAATRWQATLAETQREVQESRQDNSIAISDQFSGLENKDSAIEQEVRREDRAALASVAPEAPTFEGNHHSDQVHLSKAFSALEQQDHAIENYMLKAGDDADLSKIRTVQDESMNHISQQLKRADEHPEEGRLPPLPVGRAFLETPIHDQWASFEKSDGQAVKDIKRDPNLRAFIQRGVTSRYH